MYVQFLCMTKIKGFVDLKRDRRMGRAREVGVFAHSATTCLPAARSRHIIAAQLSNNRTSPDL